MIIIQSASSNTTSGTFMAMRKAGCSAKVEMKARGATNGKTCKIKEYGTE